MSRYQRGSAGTVVLVVAGLILSISLFSIGNRKGVFILPPVPGDITYSPTLTAESPSSGGTKEVVQSASDHISLSLGNASYAYQPYEEYITISNYGSGPVNITGWKLTNAKGERVYENNQRFSSDSATIPRAASGDIILAPGDTAIVTTGSVTNQYPYKITSFKENMCSGYLEDSGNYSFTPNLTRSCPMPSEEDGVSGLERRCLEFVERLSSCHAPEFNTKDAQGDTCYNCADHVPLPSSCILYLKSHYNYDSCVANHASDPNFYSNTWRVFLGRGWEMWADKYETISLYNKSGKLVESVSY